MMQPSVRIVDCTDLLDYVCLLVRWWGIFRWFSSSVRLGLPVPDMENLGHHNLLHDGPDKMLQQTDVKCSRLAGANKDQLGNSKS